MTAPKKTPAKKSNPRERRKKGAPAGNQFWKLRAKHGRDKLFVSPQLLWEAACEYFQWCEDNPMMSLEIYGKDATECDVPKMRPFTIQGLAHYLDVNTDYLTDFMDNLKGKEDSQSKDFSRIITRIREIIFRQKFEGAAAGFFNANVISRDLGLVDKKQQSITTEQPLFGPLEEGNNV